VSSAPSLYHRVTACRVCAGASFGSVVDLGETPLANALVARADAGKPEPQFPLEAIRCLACGLVQLSVVVSPEAMFRNYVYATSASTPMVSHFDSYADEVVRLFAPAGSAVVEIGSNDGVLLRPLVRRGVRTVGVEPATNLAAAANESGLETINDFFGADVARRIATGKGPVNAVLANNVLAHIDDLAGVLEGVEAVLAPDGVFVVEVPYLLDLFEHVEYDTIYHEHLSYFAIGPLTKLMEHGGLELFDLRRVAVHGGSLRVFAGRPGRRPITNALRDAMSAEAATGLGDQATYDRFAAQVSRSREALRTVIARARADRRSVAALGATAKGNTLLNYCGLTSADIAFVADSTPIKQGRLTPGTHIPIREDGALVAERPDYTLLLAWNYADAILDRYAAYLQTGGRFIHPIPVARFIP